MGARSRMYGGTIDPSARERELCAERRWAEAGGFLEEIVRRVPEWRRPAFDQRFQEARLGEYAGVRDTMYTDQTYTDENTASARERDMNEERRWEEAGQAVHEAARHIQDWLRWPP